MGAPSVVLLCVGRPRPTGSLNTRTLCRTSRAPGQGLRPERGRPSVWPHKSGKGFDLLIPEGISISGRIVCTEPMEQAEG